MALVGIELVTHVSEPDALTTRPEKTNFALYFIFHEFCMKVQTNKLTARPAEIEIFLIAFEV